MAHEFDLPFKVGEEVEAKFNETGYRGAWFRCRVLKIKPSVDYELLLEYLDFEEEGNSWVKVRQAEPAANSQPGSKGKKPLIWMARPVPPLVHERDIKKYQKDIRLGRKKAGCVYMYNDDVYTVGDMVEWWKDDCYWVGRIIEMKSKERKAKIKFPPPPHGEGSADTVSLKDLRPCFIWHPPHQWTPAGSKRRDARGNSGRGKIDKAHLPLVYLSGYECTSTVVPDVHCDSTSSGDANFHGDLKLFEEAADALRALGHERGNSGGSRELAVTSDRHNEDSGHTPVLSQSASGSKHGTEEQSAKFSANSSDIVLDFEGEGLLTTAARATSSDAAADQLLLASTSGGKETDSQAVAPIAGECIENFESIDGFGEFNPSPEQCLNDPAADTDDASVTASVDLSNVRSVGSGDGPENLVTTPGNEVRPSNAVHEMYVGIRTSDTVTCRTSAVETSVCANVAELPKTLVAHAQDSSSTPGLVAERDALDSTGKCIAREHAGICDPEAKVVTGDTSDGSPCVNFLVHAEDTAVINNSLNTVIIAARAEYFTDVSAEQLSPFGNGNVSTDEVTRSECHIDRVVADVSISAELGRSDIPPNDHVAFCDPYQDLHPMEGLASVLNDDFSTRLSGHKLSSHVGCVAIQNAVKLVISRKRRRKKDRFRTGPKRACHVVEHQTVQPFVSQTDGPALEPPTWSVPTTPSNDEKRISTLRCTVEREAGMNEPNSRIPEFFLSPECQKYGCSSSAGIENDPLSRALALTSIHESRLQAVGASADLSRMNSTSNNDTEAGCYPGGVENRDLDEYLGEETERLIERVHSLRDQLHDRYRRKWKRVFWKMSDGSVFSSEAEGLSNATTEALEANRNFLSSLELDNAAGTLPCLLVQGTREHQSNEVTSSVEVSNDFKSSVTTKLHSNLKVTKRIKKCRSLRTLASSKTQTLSDARNEFVNVLLSKAAVVYSKLNSPNRSQDKNTGPENICQNAKLDVTKAVVGGVHNSATCSSAVEPSRMRGSINILKGKTARLKCPRARKKRSVTEKAKVADVGNKAKLVDSALVRQHTQNFTDVLNNQDSSAGIASGEFRAIPRLLVGSTLETIERTKLDSEAIVGDCQEIIKLQLNGNWCIKSYTVDGEPVWIGNYQTKELALNSYAVVNLPTDPKVKDAPPINQPSSSRFREQASGNRSSPAHVVEAKELKGLNVERVTGRNISESCNSVNRGINISIARSMNEDKRKNDGLRSLEKTSLVDEQDGTNKEIITAVGICNQDLSVIASEEDASLRWRISEERNIKGISTRNESTFSRNLIRNPVRPSSTRNYVDAVKSISPNRNNQDNFPVKSEVAEPSTVTAAVDRAQNIWTHDLKKCKSGKEVLDSITINDLETKQEKEVATQVRTALWRGLCCSPPLPGLVSLGIDVVRRTTFFTNSRMHFEVVSDGDLKKILLSSGKIGEEIYIGHWKTDDEVHAARKIVTRCKKALAKLMTEFVSSSKPSDSSVETCAEGIILHERPIKACNSSGRLNVLGLTLNNEIGQSCSSSNKSSTIVGDTTQNSASARASSHQTLDVEQNDKNKNIQAIVGTVAALDCCQVLSDSRTVGGQADFTGNQSLSEDIIILEDDDDDDYAHVPSARGFPPRSRSDGLFKTVTVGETVRRNHMTNIQVNPLTPIAPSQSHNIVHGNRDSRAGVLLERSSHSGQEHNQGYHFTVDPRTAGLGTTGQVIHNDPETGNSSNIPIVRVQRSSRAGEAHRIGTAHIQSQRQGGLGSMSMAVAPSIVGDAQLTLGNRNSDVPIENSLRNRLNCGQTGVKGLSLSSYHGTHSMASDKLPNMSKFFYDCCPNIEPYKQDLISCKGLFCGSCNRLIHTQCALQSRQLNLTRFPLTSMGGDFDNTTEIGGQEQALYRCLCGRTWSIVPEVLSRMKDFIRQIWDHQYENLVHGTLVNSTTSVTVLQLNKGKELKAILNFLSILLGGAKNIALLQILEMVRSMKCQLSLNADKVNFLEWLASISAAVRLIGSNEDNS